MEIIGIILAINTILNGFWFFIIIDVRDRVKRMEDIHLKNNFTKE
jgi:hypothetical protein